jgi:mycoredoxin
MAEPEVQVYGTRWCPDCHRAKQVFNKLEVPFVWHDIEADAVAAACVQKINGGYKSVPTLVFPDGSILVEPNNAELEKKLESLSRTHH